MKLLTLIISISLVNPLSAIALDKPENGGIYRVAPDYVCIDKNGNPITCPKDKKCYSVDSLGNTIRVRCPETCFENRNGQIFEIDCK